jgi:hypothetical protein
VESRASRARRPPGLRGVYDRPIDKRKRYQGHVHLYGTREAADYLDISRRNLSRLLADRKVVKPVARLACGPVWSQSQLEEQRFLWRNGGPTKLDELQIRQMTLARRLGVLEQRWDALVRALAEDEKRKPVARWEGDAARKRRNQGRSALATLTEARHALAEGRLLRLVADLADQDPVFAGIAQELDEAANLRTQLAKVKQARKEQANGASDSATANPAASTPLAARVPPGHATPTPGADATNQPA